MKIGNKQIEEMAISLKIPLSDLKDKECLKYVKLFFKDFTVKGEYEPKDAFGFMEECV